MAQRNQFRFASDIREGDVLTVAGTNYIVESDPRTNGQEEIVVHLRINAHTATWIEMVLLPRVVVEVFTTVPE